MNWTFYVVVIVVMVAVLLMRRGRQITVQSAQTLLREGATVVDVRTAGEFASGHLPGAINIPLDSIETKLPARIPDRNQTILLHCQTGMRSGMAAKKLRALGYNNVHNIGGYARAANVVGGK